MTTSLPSLPPCLRCGAIPHLSHGEKTFCVYCPNNKCPETGCREATEAEAVKAWTDKNKNRK